MKIKILNEEIDLLPERALLWKKHSLLAFSDVHLGKAESYQAAGIPMPSGSHREDLNLITRLIAENNPVQILILGDWIHNKNSWSDELTQDLDVFFELHKARRWTLILGNHERGSQTQLARLPINLQFTDLTIGPFTFTHGHNETQNDSPPEAGSGRFTIQGHIHPAVRLKEGSTSLRLPAFILTTSSLILPAFGSQTGGYELKLNKKDRIFPTTGKSIFEL